MLEPPITAQALTEGLRRLGIQPGAAILLHCSLRALAGPQSMVVGGAEAVIDAACAAVTPDGLLVLPAFSAVNSEPSRWTSPPVPSSWWPIIREHWPPFRRDATPTFRLGVVAECFRCRDGVLRSEHPSASFAAWGRDADAVVAPHPLEGAFADDGPLERLYARDAAVVMLGTEFDTCTCFHLAEHRTQDSAPGLEQGGAVLIDGERRWVTWQERPWSTHDFVALGQDFERAGHVHAGNVGRARSRVFRLRDAVDFAVPWLVAHRAR